MSPIVPLVLCGGSGSRLWPMSRLDRPKQFQPVSHHSPRTYFQSTVERHRVSGFGEPIVVTGIDQAPTAKRQMADLGCPVQILTEPLARNTGPAVLAAALLARQQDPETLLLTVPSDHVIDGDLNGPVLAMRAVAKAGYIVCFGVEPRYAETGYGYMIKGEALPGLKDSYRVEKFVEKPNTQQANALLKTGRAYWAAGISLFRADVLCDEYQRLDPKTYKAVHQAITAAAPTDLGLNLEKTGFEKAQKRPTEQVIFEHSDRLVLAPLQIKWTDIGAWNTLHGSKTPNPEGNVTQGDVIALDTQNSLIQSQDRLVAVVGMSDLIVIDTPDALLVTDKAHAQSVKSVVEFLKQNHRTEFKTGHASEDLLQNAPAIDHKALPLTVAPHAKRTLPVCTAPGAYLVVLAGNCRCVKHRAARHLKPGQILPLTGPTGWQVENRSAEILQALMILPASKPAGTKANSSVAQNYA